MSRARSYATIVFKSGATIDIDVRQISVARDRISGEISKIEWVHHDEAARRLVDVQLEDVSAVVFHERAK